MQWQGICLNLKLREDVYNLQRFLFRQNLDIDEEVLEGIIITLMYGVKSAKDFEQQFPSSSEWALC